MVTSISSTSSCSSFDSFDDLLAVDSSRSIKFLCSYGGRILPRYPDGKLRYVGGETRVLAVPRSIAFSELEEKMMKLCGSESPVILRCQLPSEDLDDALVSVTSDEDIANLLEEHELASRDRVKIRAFLSPKPSKSQAAGSSNSPPPGPVRGEAAVRPPLHAVVRRCNRHIARQHVAMHHQNRLR